MGLVILIVAAGSRWIRELSVEYAFCADAEKAQNKTSECKLYNAQL